MKCLDHFLQRCEDASNALVYKNAKICGEYVPEALKKMPLAVALVAWLLFSVLWITVAGPITLVVEAVLALFNTIKECRDVCSEQALETLACNVVAMLILLGLFVFCRFESCVAAFSEGILEPRKGGQKVAMAC